MNRLAMASFGLSMLGFIPPIGIASIVMGHMARRQIGRSQGRESGNAYAMLGLLLSYGQIFLVVLICWLLTVLAREINQKLPDGPTVQDFVLDRLLHGDPNHPSAAQAVKQQENARAVLRMIAARQDGYQAAHPQGNAFACDLNELTPGSREDEVWVRIRASNYAVKASCRMQVVNGIATAVGWAATAYPRAEGASQFAYCIDETKILRRYAGAGTLGAMTPYAAQPCPEEGEPVE